MGLGNYGAYAPSPVDDATAALLSTGASYGARAPQYLTSAPTGSKQPTTRPEYASAGMDFGQSGQNTTSAAQAAADYAVARDAAVSTGGGEDIAFLCQQGMLVDPSMCGGAADKPWYQRPSTWIIGAAALGAAAIVLWPR